MPVSVNEERAAPAILAGVLLLNGAADVFVSIAKLRDVSDVLCPDAGAFPSGLHAFEVLRLPRRPCESLAVLYAAVRLATRPGCKRSPRLRDSLPGRAMRRRLAPSKA